MPRKTSAASRRSTAATPALATAAPAARAAAATSRAATTRSCPVIGPQGRPCWADSPACGNCSILCPTECRPCRRRSSPGRRHIGAAVGAVTGCALRRSVVVQGQGAPARGASACATAHGVAYAHWVAVKAPGAAQALGAVSRRCCMGSTSTVLRSPPLHVKSAARRTRAQQHSPFRTITRQRRRPCNGSSEQRPQACVRRQRVQTDAPVVRKQRCLVKQP